MKYYWVTKSGCLMKTAQSAASDMQTLGKRKPGLRLFQVFCLVLNVLLYSKYLAALDYCMKLAR